MASHIASLIMEAMNAECCQNFAGPKHTLVDFHRMMTRLVEMEDSQYSYRNVLAAYTSGGILAGICVAYDGGKLHQLRRRFYEAALEAFGIDYTGMTDETEMVSSILTVSPSPVISVERALLLSCFRLLLSVGQNLEYQQSVCLSIKVILKLRLSISVLVLFM